jgi:hypothetical protein
MRVNRLFSLTTLAVLLVAAGCGPARHAATDAATPASQKQRPSPAPAPSDPDLGTVMERFYQYVEGAHWPFAYAMLSPRYRATLTQVDLERRYENLADADVALRHSPGTVVTARLSGVDRNDRSRRVRIDETIKLVWDGEQWKIDDIARRTQPR